MKQFIFRHSVPFGIVAWIALIIIGYNYNGTLGVGACVLPIIVMTIIA